MTDTGLTVRERKATTSAMRWLTMIPLLASAACVNVSAPDKPIEINLNINVTQEVVYRLDNDAKTVIQQNPGIF